MKRFLGASAAVLIGSWGAVQAQCFVEELDPGTSLPHLEFGSAVAIDGSRALVGVGLGKGSEGPGTAVFYNRQGSAWIKQSEVWASDGSSGGAGPGDQFGFSVAIDGDVAVVGAPYHTLQNPFLLFAGAAYVYRRVGGIWVEEAKLQPTDPEQSGRFGASVDVQGDTIVVGKPHDGNYIGSPDIGGVYVFKLVDGTWVQEAKLLASQELDTSTLLGLAVSLDGDRILAGAPSAQGNGTAYLYENDGVSWSEVTFFQSPGTALFGISTSLDGDRAIVGDNAGGFDGTAFIYHNDGGVWAEEAQLLIPVSQEFDQPYFGRSVALEGDRVLIGAPQKKNEQVFPALERAGAAYLYSRVQGSWVLTGELHAPVQETGAYFGWALDMAQGNAIVGAPAITQNVESAAHAFGYQTGIMTGDVGQISLVFGGAQFLTIQTSPGFWGDLYMVLGSFGSGCPGIAGDHGVLPLVADSYFYYTLFYPNGLPLLNTLNFVDQNGMGGAFFSLPAGMDPLLAGTVLHHAYVVIDPSTGVVESTSNSVPLTLLP